MRRRAEAAARKDADEAKAQVAAKAGARDPASWGIDRQIRKQGGNREDVVAVKDPSRRGQFIHARRSDAFSAITLSVRQEAAAKRYCRDWAQRAGAKTDDDFRLEVVVDNSPGLAPGQHVTQRIIDAGARIEAAHGLVGLGSARLLAALIEPLVMRGEVRVWRELVRQVTGETERHAQAASVRAACENLVLAYVAVDEAEQRRRTERPRFAGGGNAP